MKPVTHRPPWRFDLPLNEIRCGYRSAVYFWRAKRILERLDRRADVVHQVFQKHDHAVLAGLDEALAVLWAGAGTFRDDDRMQRTFAAWQTAQQAVARARYEGDATAVDRAAAERHARERELDDLWLPAFDQLAVSALAEGDEVAGWETVMHIQGDYRLFAPLESVYLGVLARRTRIASRTHEAVAVANDKPVLFFADRFDHFAAQEGDGAAALLGGCFGVCTPAMAAWTDQEPLGTIPHALIVSFGGDAVEATRQFDRHFPEANTIALVDFDNDCVTTSVSCARALGERLWGVRLDTAERLVDRALQADTDRPEADRRGVTPRLVEKTREALDAEGFQHVKIVVSGGFNPERIAQFESREAPVDAYAIGSWMLGGRYDFTADAVRLDGRDVAKVGRQYRPNPRLQPVRFAEEDAP